MIRRKRPSSLWAIVKQNKVIIFTMKMSPVAFEQLWKAEWSDHFYNENFPVLSDPKITRECNHLLPEGKSRKQRIWFRQPCLIQSFLHCVVSVLSVRFFLTYMFCVVALLETFPGICFLRVQVRTVSNPML
jgi:hypothetical protein